tara:strand:- start:1203 stop:1994 length:792 start_codon:yes stop_codon:yes gene_type:complete
MKMYCISMENSHLEKIKILNYIPVGLGTDKFDKEWTTDNTGKNISFKNKFYGENTFHYWLWKNQLKDCFEKKWVGFCHYRRFWVKNLKVINFEDLKTNIINKIPDDWNSYEVILGNEYLVNKTKISKIIKHGKKQLLKNPFVFFSKKKMTIKVHFDMYHGFGNLDKAIELLDINDREDFRNYVNSAVSFNPFNMFFCKSYDLLNNYYSVLFKWLEKCESEFGFDETKDYGQIRIYAFLAERFLSYWFKKNSNFYKLHIKHFEI